jgi:hypothetical protein
MGAEGIPVDVGKSRFTVFRKGENVQVIRTSREALPKKEEVFEKAAIAIREATGCAVKPNTMDGDPAVVDARLAC